jgi:hypothetical protein
LAARNILLTESLEPKISDFVRKKKKRWEVDDDW